MSSVRMEPATATRLLVAPSALQAEVTATPDCYVIGHFGLARLAGAGWAMRVEGEVDRPLELDLAGLRALPSVTVTAVLECFGNPLEPEVPTRRVANVTWRGVPVSELLDRAGARPGAGCLWASGLDSGEFAGERGGYLKDVPLAVAAERGIVAYEMNGQPLTEEHGFPARLFVPGYFGTNNVKWLHALTVATERPEHRFTTRLYQRVEPGSPNPVPVRNLDVNSIITDHRPGTISGWAWGSAEVVGVRVRVGEEWLDAELDSRAPGTFGWQRFLLARVLGPGTHSVAVRARDAAGREQPLDHARNAVHEITVRVRR